MLVLGQMIGVPDLRAHFRLHDELFYQATRRNLDGQMRLYAVSV